jgi:UDP-glucose 4-epimerase
MKILITGVCGFIGSHLARKLVQNRKHVIGVDNLSYGFKENVADLENNDNFEFFNLDITSDEFVDKFKSQNFDIVIHLACVKSPRYGNRMESLTVNSLGTENVLEIAVNSKARFIYGSTGELYGKNQELPFTEESSFRLGKPEIRRWSTVISQMYSEHLCFAYNEKYELDFSIVRYFNVYGPGQRRDWMGGPQSIFIESALEDKPMEIHGDGVQTRDLTYIDDAVEGTMKILDTPYASGEIINIGNDTQISIVNLAYMIWRLSNNQSKPKLEFMAYSDLPHLYEDIRHRVCDTTKSLCLLGFKAGTSLESGLKSTIEWHRANKGRVFS